MIRSKLSTKAVLLATGLSMAAFAGPAAAQSYICPSGLAYDPAYGCTDFGAYLDGRPYHRDFDHGFGHGMGHLGGMGRGIGVAHVGGFGHVGGGFGGGGHR
jgi:hypothetical protein